jgi:hypothetical protein
MVEAPPPPPPLLLLPLLLEEEASPVMLMLVTKPMSTATPSLPPPWASRRRRAAPGAFLVPYMMQLLTAPFCWSDFRFSMALVKLAHMPLPSSSSFSLLPTTAEAGTGNVAVKLVVVLRVVTFWTS